MAQFILEVDPVSSNQLRTINIPEGQYGIFVRYNTRMSKWILGITDANGEFIVAGVPVSPGPELFAQFKHLPIPQGYFALLSSHNNKAETSRTDLGINDFLAYIEVA